MGGQVVSRLLIIGSGLVYPAYNSYKAIKAADVRQYVRWIMYWVVFAVFSTLESFADVFISWLPFYYELKVGFVLWLALPFTKGSTYLYRKFVHPNLSKRENDIDRFLYQAKAQGYHTVMDVGSRGLNLAANAVVTAAVKGQAVVSDRLKSYSTMDISQMNDRTPIHRSQSALGNFEPVRRVTETHRRRAGSSPPPSPTPLDQQGATVSEFISQRDEGQRIIQTYLKQNSSNPTKQQQQNFQLSPHLSITSSQRSLNNQTSQPVAIRPQRPVTDGYMTSSAAMMSPQRSPPVKTVTVQPAYFYGASAPETEPMQQPTPIQEEGGDFRELEYDEDGREVFDSRPTTYTHDDMRIRRRANYAQEAVPDAELGKTYSTLPKNFDIRKERLKQMPPPPDRNQPQGNPQQPQPKQPLRGNQKKSASNSNIRRSNRKSKKTAQVFYYDDANTTASDEFQ